ncbi:VC2046/SO_2500 family protein [Colwelliaceae bacterium 6441]
MNTPSVTSNLLVEELQLGEQLNHCVHSDRRSDFALLLSMLSGDVLAHSEFKLPRTASTIKESSEELLRKEFELPRKQKLALESLDEITAFSQADLIEQNQLTTLHLTQALSPKPLCFRNDKKHINSSVLANTSLYCQQQYQRSKQDDLAPQTRLDFNVNAWLKSVQTAIVKAPLLDVTA